ncbi:hypothetical protein [Umezawaea sp. Da 62-37]|uniref:hypothetical protein n=1 Tax=Umezawaea sp. Da 62-37 TaxID=3075927 RepID=UPI0028F71388|nr:hypothetical protein [Umezawaea sp. Da 62-37]WNV90950.1 hypothetical protein RM788_22520 [Umezawaea sp. Da 62-37]
MSPLLTPARVALTILTVLTFSDIAPGLRSPAALVLAAAAGLYLLACVAFPFRKCRVCKGMGRFTSGMFGGIRMCARCDGAGLKLRAGRRVINTLRRNRRANRR